MVIAIARAKRAGAGVGAGVLATEAIAGSITRRCDR
jgi:hypothetical protein